MRKNSLYIGCCLLVCVSCQKKNLPVITDRVISPERVTTVAPDTMAGKSIFMARCSRCHGLPVPAQYTKTRWEVILSYMMPRARLTSVQKVHITAWLQANAAK